MWTYFVLLWSVVFFTHADKNGQWPPEDPPVLSTTTTVEGFVGRPVEFLDIESYSPLKYVECKNRNDESIKLDDISSQYYVDIAYHKTYGKQVASLDNTGTYICTAENYYGITTGSEFDVIIYDVQLTIEPATPLRVIYGEEIVIKCQVQANYSLYELSWIHNNEIVGIPLQSNGSFINDTLTIPAAIFVNRGDYWCRVDIGKTHTKKHIFVDVIGEASAAPVMSTSLNIEGVLGHPVGFLNITTYCSRVKCVRCQTTTGVLINLEMLEVISSNDMGTCTYGKRMSYLNFTGTYNCTAENDDGITTGSEFDVIIYGVILTIEPALTFDVSHGEEIQIKCYVQAVPELTGFSWIHNDKSLQSDGGLTNGSHTLIIPVATSVNNGQYRCRAENAKTSATSDPVNVNIIGGLPVISTNGQTHVVVHQSETVTLHCNIDSKPAALFAYWTKQVKDKEYVFDANGGNLHDPSLNFLEAKWTDTGTYICHAGNSLGNSSGSAICLFVISETPMCPCTVDYFQKVLTWNSQNVSNYTKDEWRTVLQPVLQAIEKELRIDVTTVSSFQRKKKSATNKSRSETVMGVVGAIFLAFVFGLVVIIDALSIKQHLRIIRKMWRRRGISNKKTPNTFHK